ncbi:hypothetical protein [Novipirellula aureliae]|nr:hypothetical protein [Novipirellula aureliae]
MATDQASQRTFGGTRFRWFARGTAVGMLLVAVVNALSYFVRSSDWGNLIGEAESNDEAIGFPFVVWEAGNTYNGFYADYPMLFLNVLVAVSLGSILGVVVARHRDRLNRLVEDFEIEAAEESKRPIQFSLLGLLIVTTLCAVFVAIAVKVAARPETLLAIYSLGPICLVAIAMLPRRLSWQRRVAIITPSALMLIAVAIAVGIRLGMEFDKVMMGIFLCWTPQSAVAAIALTTTLFIQQARR